jgi:integrase
LKLALNQNYFAKSQLINLHTVVSDYPRLSISHNQIFCHRFAKTFAVGIAAMKRDERTYANALRDAKPRDKAYDLALSGGLSALVATSGEKVFYWRGVINGKAGRIRLDSYDAQGKGGLNLAAARAEVRKIKDTKARGDDPRLEAKRKAAGADAPSTVIEAAERFKAEHLDAKRGERWRVEAWRILSKDVLGAKGLADYRLADVTTADLSSLVARKAKALRAAGRKGVAANRLVAVLSRFFRFCEGKGWIASSPAVRLEKPAVEKPRDRVLSEGELGLLWSALRKGDALKHAVYSDILSLLVLTGARVSEIALLRRGDVDLANGLIKLAERGGKTVDAKRTLPVGPSARVLLARFVEAAEQAADSPLFVSPAGGALDPHEVSKAAGGLVQRLGCGGFTPHDLRRTLISHLHEADFNEGIIRRLAGHKARDVHDAVYNRSERLEKVRAALEQYERHVAACALRISADREGESNVVALRKAGNI